MTIRVRIAGGLIGLLAVSTPWLGPVLQTRATDLPIDASRIEDAVRFRNDLHLAADSVTVHTSLVRADIYSNTEYGVPLTASEAAHVDRQAAIGRDIDVAALWAESKAASYGGAWIDRSGEGVAVFMIKDGDDWAENEIRSRLPAGLRVEFRAARHSLLELDAVQDRIEAQRVDLRVAGIPLVSTSIKTPTNTVEVGLAEVTDSAVATLKSEFGDAISVVVDGAVAHADACPKTGCLPAKAGIGVTSAQVGSECTLGFGVRVITGTDYHGVVTAGHCFRAGGGTGEGDDWRHSVGGVWNKVGDAEKQTWYSGADADVGLIDYSTVPADRDNYWTASGTHDVTGVMTNGEMQIGDVVCRTGRNSGHDCGYVVDTDETRDSEMEGIGTRLIDHQWVVGFDSIGGDSGGPYTASNKAWGIHNHSTDPGEAGHPMGWYSTPSWTTLEYQSRWGITFQYCLTDSCPERLP